MDNQESQIQILKSITGADFTFVPADKNPFRAPSYKLVLKTDDDWHNIAGKLNEVGILYGHIPGEHGTHVMHVVDSPMTQNRVMMADDSVPATKFEPIGKLHGNDVYVEYIRTRTGAPARCVEHAHRCIAVVNINGKRLPFYVSSGLAGKEAEYGIPSGVWYPLQGLSPRWFNKLEDFYGRDYPDLEKVAKMLDAKFPASQMKPLALDNKLPAANYDALEQACNFNFPEGVSLTDYTNFAYEKNSNAYLKHIIGRWNQEEINWLDTQDGPLVPPRERNLAMLQRKIDYLVELEHDGSVAFHSPDGMWRVKQDLGKLGIVLNMFWHRKDDSNTIYVEYDALVRAMHDAQTARMHQPQPTPQPTATEQFATGATAVKNKTKNAVINICNKIRDKFNGKE